MQYWIVASTVKKTKQDKGIVTGGSKVRMGIGMGAGDCFTLGQVTSKDHGEEVTLELRPEGTE